jgi:hypothetical protein
MDETYADQVEGALLASFGGVGDQAPDGGRRDGGTLTAGLTFW